MIQVETLSIALEKEKNDHLEALEEMRKLKDQVSSLQSKVIFLSKGWADSVRDFIASLHKRHALVVYSFVKDSKSFNFLVTILVSMKFSQ